MKILIENGINERKALMCVQKSFKKKIETSMRVLDTLKSTFQRQIDAPLSDNAQGFESFILQSKQHDKLTIDKINKEKAALQSVINEYNKNLDKIKSSEELSNRWGRTDTRYAPVCDETIELLGQFLIDELVSQNAKQAQTVDFAEKINAAISDIKIYMNQLGLYDYIKSIYQICGTYEEQQKKDHRDRKQTKQLPTLLASSKSR